MASKAFISKRIVEQFTKNIVMAHTPADLSAHQRMIAHRCKNLGMKELDLILGAWAEQHTPKMTRDQLVKFEKQVLDFETVDLYNLVLQVKVEEEFKPYEGLEYIQELRQYALKGLI